jgi:hypothetical protein
MKEPTMPTDTSTGPGPSGTAVRQVAIFHQPQPVTYRFHDSEVAAWYTDIAVPAGDYPLLGPIEHGRVGRCTALLPGTRVDEYHAALWFGVPVGDAYTPRGLGGPASYPLWMDGYALAKLLVGDRGGRNTNGWFELTDPTLEVRTRQVLTSRNLPHTWSYCKTCGDYLGPMPTDDQYRQVADRLYRAQEQRHRDQTDCPRPYMLHAGGGSVLAVGEHHELVERDHRDPFTVVYLAAGRSFATLAEAFDVSPHDRSITERVVYDDGSEPLDQVLSAYTSPITPLPARFAARHQAALAELARELPGEAITLPDDANAIDL